MKLNYDVVKEYSGLQTTMVQVPLDNDTYANVCVTKFFNNEMKNDIFLTMGKIIEQFGTQLSDVVFTEEELSAHGLTLALLYVVTDIEMPSMDNMEQVIEMYQWLSTGNKLVNILSAIPADTMEELLAYLQLITERLGDLTDFQGEGNEIESEIN